MQENLIIDQCIKAWEQRITQATKLIDALSEWAMDTEIASGRNKVVYVIGHLLVVHDKLIEGMELGDRRHADLDKLFFDAQYSRYYNTDAFARAERNGSQSVDQKNGERYNACNCGIFAY
jgi:hypothetical protein